MVKSLSPEDALLLEIAAGVRPFVVGQVPNAEVDDVVQDIVADRLARMRTGKWTHTPRNMQAFLRRAVMNQLIDRYRTRKSRRQHDNEHHRILSLTPPSWLSPDRSGDEEFMEEFIDTVLAKMSQKARDAFIMIRRRHMTYRDAAACMQVDYAALHASVREAHAMFRTELARIGIHVATARRGTAARKKRLRTSERLSPRFPRHTEEATTRTGKKAKRSANDTTQSADAVPQSTTV